MTLRCWRCGTTFRAMTAGELATVYGAPLRFVRQGTGPLRERRAAAEARTAAMLGELTGIAVAIDTAALRQETKRGTVWRCLRCRAQCRAEDAIEG